jgi:septum formation protein
MLTAARVAYEIMDAPVDERRLQDDLIRQGESPKRIAVRLAAAKAEAASAKMPNALVLAADQTVDLEGALGMKPRDMNEAARQLASMSGKTHHLHSAYCFAEAGAVVAQGVSTATLKMRPLNPHAIDAYLEAAGPAVLTSAGAYQIEDVGVHLFEKIDGDWFTILGMPLLEVLAFLRARNMILR